MYEKEIGKFMCNIENYRVIGLSKVTEKQISFIIKGT